MQTDASNPARIRRAGYRRFTHSVRLLDDGGDILTMAPGESASFTFSGPGEHRYDCSLHPNDMTGVVVVTGG